MGKIRKAVIPAAGQGTRLRPLTRYLPKPMVPLGEKPVLEHMVNELQSADIEQIAVVARSDHDALISYFENFPGLELIMDDTSSGPGGAILRAEMFVGKEEFLVAFADAPLIGTGSSDHLQRLVQLKRNKQAAAILSIYPVPASEAGSRGIVKIKEGNGDPESGMPVAEMIEKPTVTKSGNHWASSCRYVLDASIFRVLKKSVPGEGGELQLTAGIRALLAEGNLVWALPLPEGLQRCDTGTLEGYYRAWEAWLQT